MSPEMGVPAGYTDAEADARIAIHAALTATHGVAGAIADVADIAAHAANFGLHNKVLLKTADQDVISQTTLQDITQLVLAVGANEIWALFTYIRFWREETGAQNTKLAFSVPAGATIVRGARFDSYLGELNLAIGETVTGGVAIQVYPRFALYTGGATAGNIQFQMAQVVSEAKKHTINANSFIIAHRLA